MKLTKITEEQFNSIGECTKVGQKPTVKVYRGDVPTELKFKDYDLPIPAGTYSWLVFVPCELISEVNWVITFGAKVIRGLNGERKQRTPVSNQYSSIELENNGVLFAFV